MSTLTVRKARERRHRRVRGKVFGTAERPRLVVFRSNRGIEAQLVDDLEGRTLAGASWLQLKKLKGNKTRAGGRGRQGAAPSAPRTQASRPSSSTAADTSTTAASRRSQMRRAKEG